MRDWMTANRSGMGRSDQRSSGSHSLLKFI
jgi:hypothetical protein